MNEVVTEIAGVTVTTWMAAGGITLLTMILFTGLWIVGHKKRTDGHLRGSGLMNGIGFGLLPAMCVWKAVESVRAVYGAEVPEPLPQVPWLTADGCFIPARIELALAALGFALICLWLILRREDLPDQGDLLLTSLCSWAGIRIVTEGLRTEPLNIFRYLGCAAILICLIWWTARRTQIVPGGIRTAADLVATLLCMAAIMITAHGVLSSGSFVGDLAVTAGCTVMGVLLTLLAGNDWRKAAKSGSD